MNLTQNFTLEEMTASSTAKGKGIINIPDTQATESLKRLCEEILQPIRNKFGKPVKVTSGYRSDALNTAIGGSKTSQHLKGEAADIICNDNKALWNLIINMIQNQEIRVGQLIDEKNLRWIHISLPDSSHYNQILYLKP
ncbi:MAG: peptidase M15 [Muribaculaceae bacterium]|nr:peptidase M15 [Muribaculaceae bacterium]